MKTLAPPIPAGLRHLAAGTPPHPISAARPVSARRADADLEDHQVIDAPSWTGTPVPSLSPLPVPDVGRLKVHTFHSFLDQSLPDLDWRIDGLLPAIGTGLILAAEKVGKSLWAQQMALCIALGVDFMGRPVKCAPTLFIEEEGAPRRHQDRMKRQGASLGALGLERVPFYTLIRQGFRLDVPLDVDELVVIARDTGAKAIFMGPLAQITAVEDENRPGEINEILRTLNRLATEVEAVFVLLHHRRKTQQGSGPPKSIAEFFNSTRGTNALTAAIDVGIGLQREQEEDTGWLYVLHRDERSFRAPYGFDGSSLLVHPAEPPEKTVKAPASRMLEILTDEGELSVMDASLRTGVHANTARARLEELVLQGSATKSNGPRGKQLYHPNPREANPDGEDEQGSAPTLLGSKDPRGGSELTPSPSNDLIREGVRGGRA